MATQAEIAKALGNARKLMAWAEERGERSVALPPDTLAALVQGFEDACASLELQTRGREEARAAVERLIKEKLELRNSLLEANEDIKRLVAEKMSKNTEAETRFLWNRPRGEEVEDPVQSWVARLKQEVEAEKEAKEALRKAQEAYQEAMDAAHEATARVNATNSALVHVLRGEEG